MKKKRAEREKEKKTVSSYSQEIKMYAMRIKVEKYELFFASSSILGYFLLAKLSSTKDTLPFSFTRLIGFDFSEIISPLFILKRCPFNWI